MSKVEFYLAHLSDLHLASKPNRVGLTHRRKLLERVGFFFGSLFSPCPKAQITGSYCEASYIALKNRLQDGFFGGVYSGKAVDYDGIIISGDISTHGSFAEMQAAAVLSRDLLSSVEARQVVLIPGNHDRFTSIFNLPGSTQFEDPEHFGLWWSLGEPDQRFYDSPYVKAQFIEKNGVKLALINADLSLRGLLDVVLLPFLAYLDAGKIRSNMLECLDEASELAKESKSPAIWVMHFPPLISRIFGVSNLTKLINRCRVGIVLSGHTHKENYGYRYGDSSTVVVAGSALAVDGEKSFFELKVVVDAQFNRIEYIDANLIELTYLNQGQAVFI